MTSERKAAASRANGAKSRGPKTAETREISSRNSLRHGFASRKTILLRCEDPEEFQQLLDDYYAAYQPIGPIEQDLVNEMASARWRSTRLSMIATSLLDMEREAQPPQTDESADPARPLALGFKALVDGSRAVPLAMRYEFRLCRVHDRAFATLRDLQRERRQLAPEEIKKTRNEPEPVREAAPAPGGPSVIRPLTEQDDAVRPAIILGDVYEESPVCDTQGGWRTGKGANK
jgi:hypothetical protein